jgi:hypothetical protein
MELFNTKYVSSSARFSHCGSYRYQLVRQWGNLNTVMFIGLNPSTADEKEDDPTIRRCVGFANEWGYGRLFMANVFAYRSTDPKILKSCDDPVGEFNDYWLGEMAKFSGLVVACWGVHATLHDRDKQVKKAIPNMKCFGLTKEGHPKHPLYLPKETKLISFT